MEPQVHFCSQLRTGSATPASPLELCWDFVPVSRKKHCFGERQKLVACVPKHYAALLIPAPNV